MPNTTIPLKTYTSGLPDASSLSGSELFYGVQNSNSVKVTTSQIRGSVAANQVSNIPTAPVSATDVQAAINQLASLIPSPGTGTDPLFLTLGLQLTVYQPAIDTSGGAHQSLPAQWIDCHYNGAVSTDPTFSNMYGLYLTMFPSMGDATYSSMSQAKTTFANLWLDLDGRAGGQRFCRVEKFHSYGMGDAFFESQIAEFGNGPIPGDEGIGFASVSSVVQFDTAETATIAVSFKASGNTTTTQAIFRNFAAQTVTVASTANINVGEWYVIGQQLASNDYNAEAVKILDVGTGTITAVFRNHHTTVGTTVTPALVLNYMFGQPGHLRVLVNLDGASYSTGTVTGTFGGGALTGNGTTWATNMVGGGATNIGAISLDKDIWSDTGMRSWYEINQDSGPTQLNIFNTTIAGDESYKSNRGTFPTNYIIRPAVKILYIDAANNMLICESTTTTWSVGHHVECVVCPYPDMTGFSYGMGAYTAGALFRGMIAVRNSGPVSAGTAISVGGFNPTQDLPYNWLNGYGANNCSVGVNLQVYSQAMVITRSAGATGSGLEWVGGGAFGGLVIDRGVPSGMDITWNADFHLRTRDANSGINTDPDLGLIYTHDSWLWLHSDISSGTSPKPYIVLQDMFLRTSDANFPPAVGIGTNVGAWNFYGTDTGASSAFSSLHSWGMGTSGVLQTKPKDITLVNGVNNDFVVDPPSSFIRIVGPTAPFTIKGIQQLASIRLFDGAELIIYNSVAFAMTLANDAATDNAANGILTLTGGDVTLRAGTSSALLKYRSNRWILISSN